MPNDDVDKIANIIEREVLHQTTIPFGEVDWKAIAEKVYRQLLTDAAVKELLGPGDTVRIDVPIRYACQCEGPMLRTDYHRGTFCTGCGLPA